MSVTLSQIHNAFIVVVMDTIDPSSLKAKGLCWVNHNWPKISLYFLFNSHSCDTDELSRVWKIQETSFVPISDPNSMMIGQNLKKSKKTCFPFKIVFDPLSWTLTSVTLVNYVAPCCYVACKRMSKFAQLVVLESWDDAYHKITVWVSETVLYRPTKFHKNCTKCLKGFHTHTLHSLTITMHTCGAWPPN